MKLIDLTKKRFGRLEVIEKCGRKNTKVLWRCKCDCGNEVIVRGIDLRNGATHSCGCLQRELLGKRSTRHGMRQTRIYNIWGLMVSRCTNPNTPCYNRYGGRGIEVCPEWRESFRAFYEWSMLNGYEENLTIDRINNDEGYSPSNCRWVTMKVQANNTSRNHALTFNGQTHTLAEWAALIGIHRNTLTSRIVRGWDTERAITTPIQIR